MCVCVCVCVFRGVILGISLIPITAKNYAIICYYGFFLAASMGTVRDDLSFIIMVTNPKEAGGQLAMDATGALSLSSSDGGFYTHTLL